MKDDDVPETPTQSVSSLFPTTTPIEKGPLEETGVTDCVIEEVLAHFNARAGKNLRLTVARRKLIARRLKDWTVAELKRAIDGFITWREHKPGRIELSSVLDSYPGGHPVDERIEFWIEQASTTVSTTGLDVHTKRLLERVRYTIQTEGGERSRGKAAFDELKKLGYVVKREGNRVWLERPSN